MVTSLIGGCGEKTTTSVGYYHPNWMPDGRIIARKDVITSVTRWWGENLEDVKVYVTAITADGSKEVDLYQAGGGLSNITCSPTGELIAYTRSRVGTQSAIVVSDYAGNENFVPNTEFVESLDWSPDATKLVYTDKNRDMYIINRDGTGKTKIASSAETVAWRVGEKIVYEDSVYNKIWLFDSEKASKEVVVTSISSMPQISNDNKIVFRGAGDLVKSINMDGEGETVLFSDYDRATLKLSFDNKKIVGGAYAGTGIWVVDITGSNEVRLR